MNIQKYVGRRCSYGIISICDCGCYKLQVEDAYHDLDVVRTIVLRAGVDLELSDQEMDELIDIISNPFDTEQEMLARVHKRFESVMDLIALREARRFLSNLLKEVVAMRNLGFVHDQVGPMPPSNPN